MNKDIELLTREIKALRIPPEIAAKLPPPCFIEMEGRWDAYEHRTKLSASFPVLEKFTNPLGNMQGGYVTAAFDNTFGPLSFVAARAATITIDLNTQYIRAIPATETLSVTARIVMRGFSTIYMTAEATNSSGKLIATAATNMLILRLPK